MGGVARRATTLRDVRTKNPAVPILVVDTGNFTRQTDSFEDPANRWVVEAFEALGLHAISTSAADLRRLHRMAELGRLPREIRAQYVATALETVPASRFSLRPYAIVTIRSQQNESEARAGVLALTQPAAADGLVRPMDGVESLKRYVPEVDAQSDIVVLLTRMSDAELFRTAAMFPAIDVIVNGSPTGEGRDLGRQGNAVIVEAAHSGVALGVLDLEWDARGRVTKYRDQQIPLPPGVPDSPALAEIIDKSRRDASSFAEEEAKKSPPVTAASIFAGAKACVECHEKAYKVWEKSAHARAIRTLVKGGNQYNRECLQCHVTGFGVGRGFVNLLRTPQLANVQCEACHDASSDHARSPTTTHPGIGLMQQLRHKVPKGFCLRCHTPENSPKFSYETYWPKIAH